jgi:hypothetical protein
LKIFLGIPVKAKNPACLQDLGKVFIKNSLVFAKKEPIFIGS